MNKLNITLTVKMEFISSKSSCDDLMIELVNPPLMITFPMPTNNVIIAINPNSLGINNLAKIIEVTIEIPFVKNV